jgi:hypothetical protein
MDETKPTPEGAAGWQTPQSELSIERKKADSDITNQEIARRYGISDPQQIEEILNLNKSVEELGNEKQKITMEGSITGQTLHIEAHKSPNEPIFYKGTIDGSAMTFSQAENALALYEQIQLMYEAENRKSRESSNIDEKIAKLPGADFITKRS